MSLKSELISQEPDAVPWVWRSSTILASFLHPIDLLDIHRAWLMSSAQIRPSHSSTVELCYLGGRPDGRKRVTDAVGYRRRDFSHRRHALRSYQIRLHLEKILLLLFNLPRRLPNDGE
jgi:hypothetical protein